MIVIAGTVRLPPENVAAALPHIRALVEATLAEDGCSVYAYSEDLLSPGLIHIAETWRDMDALKAHFKAPHIAVWREASAALGIHDRDLSMFEAGEPKKL